MYPLDVGRVDFSLVLWLVFTSLGRNLIFYSPSPGDINAVLKASSK